MLISIFTDSWKPQIFEFVLGYFVIDISVRTKFGKPTKFGTQTIALSSWKMEMHTYKPFNWLC